jgi:hypothetical protein
MSEALTEAEYHAHPALSYSVGKVLLRSPLHYLDKLANREESTEFDVGHAIHSLVLGVGSDIVEIQHDTYRTKEARELRDAAYADGKVPVKTADLAPAKRAAEAVLANPTARAWVETPGAVELSLFATDPETGVAIRGKLDKLADIGRCMVPVDLKSVTDARASKVFASVRDYDYDLQAAMYRLLVKLALDVRTGPGVLIAVEKTRPYGVACYQLSHEDFIAAGDLKLRTILARAAALRDNPDAWQGYPLGTHVLTPSSYYLTDLEERLNP